MYAKNLRPACTYFQWELTHLKEELGVLSQETMDHFYCVLRKKIDISQYFLTKRSRKILHPLSPPGYGVLTDA